MGASWRYTERGSLLSAIPALSGLLPASHCTQPLLCPPLSDSTNHLFALQGQGEVCCNRKPSGAGSRCGTAGSVRPPTIKRRQHTALTELLTISLSPLHAPCHAGASVFWHSIAVYCALAQGPCLAGDCVTVPAMGTRILRRFDVPALLHPLTLRLRRPPKAEHHAPQDSLIT